jgi:hypothetical protein
MAPEAAPAVGAGAPVGPLERAICDPELTGTRLIPIDYLDALAYRLGEWPRLGL